MVSFFEEKESTSLPTDPKAMLAKLICFKSNCVSVVGEYPQAKEDDLQAL
jgi:hypothetical protein